MNYKQAIVKIKVFFKKPLGHCMRKTSLLRALLSDHLTKVNSNHSKVFLLERSAVIDFEYLCRPTSDVEKSKKRPLAIFLLSE